MTVIRPNSISGITSLTAHRGSIDFYAHDGSAARFDNINSNVTSGVSTFASLNITGDLDVGGALTYEDVTNVDSIGVVTARAGINATGDITFGANSKAKLFENGTQSGVQVTNSGSSAHLMTHDGNEDIHVDPSGYIKFEVAGLERLRVTSGGDLFVAGTGGMNTTKLPNGSTINVNGTGSNDGLGVIRYSTGYGAYGLNIGRSKSDTIGTNAAVTNGNDLGHISFYGADGTDFNMAAQITSQVDGTPSDGTDMPGRLVFKTSSEGSATPTERFRIKSDGKLMTQAAGYIYTTSSAGSLSLYGGNTNLGGGIVLSGGNSNSDIRFYAQASTSSPAERVRIDSDGCVRVGNTHSQTTSSNTKRIALGAKGSIWGWTSGNINGALTLADNYYWDGSNNRAIEADDAAYLSLRSGSLRFGTTDSTPSAGGVTGLTEKFRITSDGNVSINHDNPNTRLYVRDTGANISSNGNAILNSTQKGIRLVNHNNDDSSLGLWFTTGDSHHAGISGQRNDSANTWGTDLRFYTHEDATNDLTYARERLRINPQGLLITRKGQNAVNTGGTILGRYKYTQQNQGSGYAHLILGADGRKLQDYITTNCYCIITVCVTGTGTNNMYCQYYYHATSNGTSSTLTHMYGNSGSSSNRPYMNLQNTHDPAWLMSHSGGYTQDIEVAVYGGATGYTYTTEYGNFTTNP